jgi:hypothetical protein
VDRRRHHGPDPLCAAADVHGAQQRPQALCGDIHAVAGAGNLRHRDRQLGVAARSAGGRMDHDESAARCRHLLLHARHAGGDHDERDQTQASASRGRVENCRRNR